MKQQQTICNLNDDIDDDDDFDTYRRGYKDVASKSELGGDWNFLVAIFIKI